MSVEPIHSQQRCFICAEPLYPGALRCNKCELSQVVRLCPSCELPTPKHTARCVHCSAYGEGGDESCWLCGWSIPKKAVRCSNCNTFQRWRRFVPASQITLALILSIISVISTVVPPVVRYYTNHSATYVRVLGDGFFKEAERESEPTIRVLVANNGRRPSFVKSARLTFANSIHAVDTDLYVKNPDDAMVPPEKTTTLHFSVASIGRRDGKTKKQVLTELAGGVVTIRVTVEETDRNGEWFDAVAEHQVTAEKIYRWMAERVSSD